MNSLADLQADDGGSWRRNLLIAWRRRGFVRLLEVSVLALMLLTAGGTYMLLRSTATEQELMSPPVVALLLVLNLLPAIALLVLLGRRVAKRRAANSPVGGDGRLHVRLVAIFSIIASAPMLLVVIFASLLFQYGVQFWFSQNARGMLQNASVLATGYYQQNRKEVADETIAMATDIRTLLQVQRVPLDSQDFKEQYVFQVVTRKLNESAVIQVGPDGVPRTAAMINPDNRDVDRRLTKDVVERLARGEMVVVKTEGDRIEAVTPLDPAQRVYLYASRSSDVPAFSQMNRAQAVLTDYDRFMTRSRELQLQFNAALFVGSLLLVGLAVWIALALADRLVRPVGELVDAARRVTAGDLSTRVSGPFSRDEIGTLATAFNRMTQRLEAQTGALVSANSQLDSRRAFIEAVLSGVTAGVLSVDRDGMVQLINSSAMLILVEEGQEPLGQPLHVLAPELAELLDSSERAGIVQVRAHGELRTLAVKVVRDVAGQVLTFDDITQQLSDQRRAAWADVARRIAHEIKNPLTPIQLAAERLQRRYGKEIESDPGTFTRLTATIIRQVGDLRRIVDEFSSFARMPKPVFRPEHIDDIARHALFLHEVAHTEIRFSFVSGLTGVELVCDRRQIGQALTNIVKNAVEAIEPRRQSEGADFVGQVAMALTPDGDGRIEITVTDNGAGLPAERDRILEPYMTTRAKGTGLGLAIVKKIVEEHFGTISFDDTPGGGTTVRIIMDPALLDRLELEGVDTANDSLTIGR